MLGETKHAIGTSQKNKKKKRPNIQKTRGSNRKNKCSCFAKAECYRHSDQHAEHREIVCWCFPERQQRFPKCIETTIN